MTKLERKVMMMVVDLLNEADSCVRRCQVAKDATEQISEGNAGLNAIRKARQWCYTCGNEDKNDSN